MIKEVKNLYVIAVNYSEILKFERETWILSYKNKAFLSQYTSALTLRTLFFTFRYNINAEFFGSVIPKEEFGKSIPDGKVNNRNTGTRCEIWNKVRNFNLHYIHMCFLEFASHLAERLRVTQKYFVTNIALVPSFLTSNIFHTLFWCFHCWLRTNKCWLSLVLLLVWTFIYFHQEHIWI